MALRTLIAIIIAGLFSYSCASTEGTISSTSESNSLFPSWYSNTGFQADSLSFHGFGTAISADSALAVTRAIENARLHLDLEIGKLAEDVRTQLETEGNSNVRNTDFILILRNAHADAVSQADPSNSWVRLDDNTFRAFASVDITKAELVGLLEEGFDGHPRYWASYSGSAFFENTFR